MKFLVDAQLPRRLSHWLGARGHDSIHTLDLPLRNATGDLEVVTVADTDDRIIVTKDYDFLALHLVSQRPQRLLYLSVGNIGNSELLRLFQRNLADVIAALARHNAIEFALDRLIVLGTEKEGPAPWSH